MRIIYDIETYPNVFTLAAEHADYPMQWFFQISPWQNDCEALVKFLHWIRDHNGAMVGFNNIGFDYPVVHMLLKMGKCSDASILYDKAMAIISSQDNMDRWAHQVKPSDHIIHQIDLFKIHHFDNMARATSLKVLEFNMRSSSIEDLPFPVGSTLTEDQMPMLAKYNLHDVSETKKFYHHTLDMIAFREELSAKHDRDFMNHNDTKIGKDYFTMKLEEAGVQCYTYGSQGRQPAQTIRPSIKLSDAILPWVKFESDELTRVLDWFKDQTITETKGVFKDLNARLNGFEFVFGLGGIHGSIDSEVVYSTDDMIIEDWDVASYYPNLAITNEFYPLHLGKEFCFIYKKLYDQRKSYKKGTSENAMLKLALNGVFGDSNSKFSIFYDPLFTMSITLNGQLLLCMLAEQLMKVEGLRMMQVNTDGLTIQYPRVWKEYVHKVCAWWEEITKLQLESAVYSRMFIRDVNNYIAEYEHETDGVKRKGAYEHKQKWHQNHSSLVIAKVAEKVLLEDAPIRETVENWPDVMDFMLRTKVPRSSQLMGQDSQGVDHLLQNVTRYYVTDDRIAGMTLVKVMPPTPKQRSEGKTDLRRIGMQSGWLVTPCNDMSIRQGDYRINYEYYIQEVEKLCLSLT